MTGRTHDLAAFTALALFIATQPVPEMSVGTAVVAFGMNTMGGLFPDIDQPTAALWNRIRAGSLIGRVIAPLLGSHRMISHSLLGMVAVGWLLEKALAYVGTFLFVDMTIVWGAFMLGFISHLCMDLFTRDGLPLLFPLSFRFGFPPIRALRISTGKFVEKSIVFPGLILLNGYILYTHYEKFVKLFNSIYK